MEFVAKRIVNFFLIFVSVFTWINDTNAQELVFEEDWAGGIGNWSASNGLWEVGTPSVGPDSCLSPPNCAGTVLTGSYPHSKQTRFLTPSFFLNPRLGEIPVLFFWHWFRLSNDGGNVQISVDEGPWENIGTTFTGTSPTWTQAGGFDLSAYVNSRIRIGFLFTSGSSFNDNGWYIDDIRIDGIQDPTSVQSSISVPTITLHQNYPNPFNPTTTIEYSIANTTPVEITIFNQLGQKVRTLRNDPVVQAGSYVVTWDGRDDKGHALASGIYLYQIRTRNFVSVKKAVLLK